MLGYLITAWFVAGILLSIQVITLKGFRKSLARDPQRLCALYNLPEDTPDDTLRYRFGPNRAIVAIAAISFAVFAGVLLRTKRTSCPICLHAFAFLERCPFAGPV